MLYSSPSSMVHATLPASDEVRACGLDAAVLREIVAQGRLRRLPVEYDTSRAAFSLHIRDDAFKPNRRQLTLVTHLPLRDSSEVRTVSYTVRFLSEATGEIDFSRSTLTLSPAQAAALDALQASVPAPALSDIAKHREALGACAFEVLRGPSFPLVDALRRLTTPQLKKLV